LLTGICCMHKTSSALTREYEKWSGQASWSDWHAMFNVGASFGRKYCLMWFTLYVLFCFSLTYWYTTFLGMQMRLSTPHS
jgi:hypothetical protein